MESEFFVCHICSSFLYPGEEDWNNNSLLSREGLGNKSEKRVIIQRQKNFPVLCLKSITKGFSSSNTLCYLLFFVCGFGLGCYFLKSDCFITRVSSSINILYPFSNHLSLPTLLLYNIPTDFLHHPNNLFSKSDPLLRELHSLLPRSTCCPETSEARIPNVRFVPGLSQARRDSMTTAASIIRNKSLSGQCQTSSPARTRAAQPHSTTRTPSMITIT